MKKIKWEKPEIKYLGSCITETKGCSPYELPPCINGAHNEGYKCDNGAHNAFNCVNGGNASKK